MTQQNLIDLGLSASSKLKYAYETTHQIQEAIKSKKIRQLPKTAISNGYFNYNPKEKFKICFKQL
jgi:hypothetical protein